MIVLKPFVCFLYFYTSSQVPSALDEIAKYGPAALAAALSPQEKGGKGLGGGGDAAFAGLLANANAGGENVHRGALLGAALGCLAGFESLNSTKGFGPLKGTLAHGEEIAQEVDAFVNAVLGTAAAPAGESASGNK